MSLLSVHEWWHFQISTEFASVEITFGTNKKVTKLTLFSPARKFQVMTNIQHDNSDPDGKQFADATKETMSDADYEAGVAAMLDKLSSDPNASKLEQMDQRFQEHNRRVEEMLQEHKRLREESNQLPVMQKLGNMTEAEWNDAVSEQMVLIRNNECNARLEKIPEPRELDFSKMTDAEIEEAQNAVYESLKGVW